MAFTLPSLPYDRHALAPLMSAETLDFHHGKHLQAYIENLNRLIAGTSLEDKPLEEIVRLSHGTAETTLYNNAAQVYNHTFFFETLQPGPTAVGTGLRRMIEQGWGTVAAFKAEWIKANMGLFGSGWTWLVQERDGRLAVRSYANAGNPLHEGVTPLLTADVWEHAYYIDHRNRRADYLEALWQLTDWGKVEARTQNGLF